MSLVPENSPFELSWDSFLKMRDLLKEKSGMFFDDNKLKVMRNVLADRIEVTKLSSFESYYQFITGGENFNSKEQANFELKRLIEALSVNETSFFRNKDHFRAIRNEVFPSILKRKNQEKTMRFWSAGCSTGQEAFSLAMEMVEFLERAGERLATGPEDSRGWRIKILASDISERVLNIASSGRFRKEELRGLDPPRLERFFNPVPAPRGGTASLDPGFLVSGGISPNFRRSHRNTFDISPQIRNIIDFQFFNLSLPRFPQEFLNSFDLVMCENVMIYFTPELTRQVIENLYHSLLPEGFLFIGFSETLWQVSDRFRLINTHDTFYYQKPKPGEPSSSSSIFEEPPKIKPPAPVLPRLKITRVHGTANLFDRASENQEQLKKFTFKKETGQKVNTTPGIFDFSTPGNTTSKVPSSEPPLTPIRDWKIALAEGISFMEGNDLEKAQAALNEAMQVGSREVEVLCANAQLLVKLGEYEKAMEYSKKAIAVNQLCEPAHLLLAMIYHRENRISEAVKEYQQSIYINFDSVIAHMRLGDIREKQGQGTNALREYKSALSALEKRNSKDYLEGFPVEILKQTCQENIRRLQKTRLH